MLHAHGCVQSSPAFLLCKQPLQECQCKPGTVPVAVLLVGMKLGIYCASTIM